MGNGAEYLDARAPSITPAPSLELLKYRLNPRQAFTETCGYVDGALFNSIYCTGGLECAINTILGAAGCCITPLSDCQLATSCINSSGVASCDTACQANEGIVKCDNLALPYCMIYQYLQDGYTLTNFACNQSPGVTEKVLPTYEGETNFFSTPQFKTVTVSVQPTTPVNPTPNPAVSSNCPASSSAHPTPHHGGGLSTGAKAGIGVGAGLGGLALLAGVFFFLRNRSRRVEETPPMMMPHDGSAPMRESVQPKHVSTNSESVTSGV